MVFTMLSPCLKLQNLQGRRGGSACSGPLCRCGRGGRGLEFLLRATREKPGGVSSDFFAMGNRLFIGGLPGFTWFYLGLPGFTDEKW